MISPRMQKILADTLVGIMLTAIAGWSLKYLANNPTITVVMLLSGVLTFVLWMILRNQPWLLTYFFPTAYVAETQLHMLVRHTERLFFAFASREPSTQFRDVLLTRLWFWHFQANCYYNLFMARNHANGAACQKRAIVFICTNRQEFRDFKDEPKNTLVHITADICSSEEVRELAKEWLKRLAELGDGMKGEESRATSAAEQRASRSD
jgi:hypothetical protein